MPNRLTSLAMNLPTDPTIWALGVAVLATGYIYLKSKKGMRRDPLGPPPAFSSLSSQRRVENQMTELLVELEKMARQMNAQLGTRAAKLEELLRQADERIAMLEQRLAEARQSTGDDRDTFRLDRPASDRHPSTGGYSHADEDGTARNDARAEGRTEAAGFQRAEFGRAEFGRAEFGKATPGRAEREELPPAPIPIDPRHAAVYRLADQGRSATEIAREVGQPAGEVELILALRRRAW